MTIARTDLPLPLLRRGKVRDVYETGTDTVLLVATDRVSAFDVVMAEAIPHKGRVLTQLTAWWLRKLEGTLAHHMITAEFDEIVEEVEVLGSFRDELDGRSMLCRRTTVFPVECVIRGYISGSAWKEYKSRGTLAGEPLPHGLVESERLTQPIFSPATKAEEGHDENITISRMAEIVGKDRAIELEDLTRRVYEFGSSIALDRGIIIADTKLEFGFIPSRSSSVEGGETAILVDEVLTPDSSRFWPVDGFEPGGPQPSFDKQPLRDYLDTLRLGGRWNGESPPPPLPPEVVEATSQRYLDIYRRLTLTPLDDGALN
jgi:phosphoribosylaminoimidazole-succinocarboxamide synthase